MSSRRGGHQAPALIVEDPGPWGVVSDVQRAMGGMMGGGGTRRQHSTPGLLHVPAKVTPIPAVGLAKDAVPVGAGPMRIAAASADPADRLWFSDDGLTLFGESPRAKRTWAMPTLTLGPVVAEKRETTLAPPPDSSHLGDDLGDLIVPAPGGQYGAVIVRDGRLPVLAILRLAPERALVRWITGVAAAAWSPDGRVLAIAGDWGLLIALEPLSPFR